MRKPLGKYWLGFVSSSPRNLLLGTRVRCKIKKALSLGGLGSDHTDPLLPHLSPCLLPARIPAFGPQGCRSRCHRLGGFRQQTFILSQLWRLEVHDQGASRLVPSLASEGESVPCSSIASEDSWLSVVFFSCRCVCHSKSLPPFLPGTLLLSLSLLISSRAILEEAHPNDLVLI